MIILFGKLASVFVVVGLGQYLAIFFIGSLDGNYDDSVVASVARYDSAIMLVTSLLSLGIGQYFSRYLIDDVSYKKSLNDSRSIRILCSLILVFVSPVFFLYDKYEYGLVMLMAPLLALGVDYALYVRGFQISGALCAFMKVSLAYAVLLLLPLLGIYGFKKDILPELYIATICLFTLLSAFFSIKILRQPILFNITIPSVRLVTDVLKLGSAFFLYSLSRTLIVPLADVKASEQELVEIFIFFKLYFLFFSVRRVYVQVVHRFLVNGKCVIRLNLIFFTLMVIFSGIYFVLKKFYFVDIFMLLANLNFQHSVPLIALIFALSIFAVYPTRLLIVHGDSYYKKILIGSSVIYIVMIIPVFLLYSLEGLIWQAAVFEFSIGCFCFLSHRSICKKSNLGDENATAIRESL